MNTTLAEALYTASQEWDTHKDGLKTYRRACTVIELLTPTPDKWNCSEVTPQHLDGVFTTLKDRLSLASSTANRYIAAFRGMYRFSHLSPPSYRARREPPGRTSVPTQDMIDKLILHIDGRACRKAWTNHTEMSTAIVLLQETGMRAGELFALRQSDVDTEENWITVRDSKSGKGRRIPVSHYTAMLAFTHLPLSLKYPSFSRKWCAARDALGYPSWFVPHSLRHMRASKLAESGAPVPVIASILGHASWKTTMRYTHVDPAALRAAVQRLPMPVAAGGETR